MRIGIVGLGLIGGSMAKAIRGKTQHSVWAFDTDSRVLLQAQAEEVIQGELTDHLSQMDLVLLAVYPEAAVTYVKEHLREFKRGAIIIDLCGVKRYVCSEIEPMLEESEVTFIGGHPMAGRELSGYGAGSATLFDGASMILTPGEQVPDEVLEEMKQFFLSLGFSRITLTTPETHDRMIALTSQLAHVVSSAYVQADGAEDFYGFSAGSFRDMTRVAKLSEDMWTELFLENRDFLALELEGLIARLQEFDRAIKEGDEQRLQGMLRMGREKKEALLEEERQAEER